MNRNQRRSSKRLQAKLGVLPMHSRGDFHKDIAEAVADRDALLKAFGPLLAGRNIIGVFMALEAAIGRTIAASAADAARLEKGITIANAHVEQACRDSFAQRQELAL